MRLNWPMIWRCAWTVALTATAAWSAGPSTPRTRLSIVDGRWHINGRITYGGAAAEGLLMNVRMVNAVYEDIGPAGPTHLPAGFDPAANTDAFIARIPDYLAHGVLAFTISLQGGMSGYEGAVNSAFAKDGTLRADYMRRIARVGEACDRHGAIVILSCFYQRQQQALAGRQTIRDAVSNVARWIVEGGHRNVVLEISNEYAHGGFRRWKDGDWLASPAGQVELIRLARGVAPGLLVSTGGMGDGRIPDAIAAEADFLLIHLNNTALADYPARIAAARRHGKPVVCNEDDKIGTAGAQAARLSVEHGASWGFMHSRKNQYVPFEFDGAADDPLVYATLRQLTLPARAGADAPADGPPRAAPTVLITSPTDGSVFAAGADVTIVAAAEGTARVDFFANATPIGSAAAYPWRITWRPPESRRYELSARALDAQNNLITSNTVDIFIVGAD